MNRGKPEQRKPRWASLVHAAEYFDCSKDTIRRYIAAGDLPGHRVGKTLKVDLNELDAMPTPVPSRRSA